MDIGTQVHLRLLGANARVGVGNTDTENLSPSLVSDPGNKGYILLEDLDALLAAHVVGNLSSEGVVVPKLLAYPIGDNTYIKRSSMSLVFATTKRR